MKKCFSYSTKKACLNTARATVQRPGLFSFGFQKIVCHLVLNIFFFFLAEPVFLVKSLMRE